MPRFEITSPDGRRFEVNAPEGATLDDAIAYAQKQFKPVAAYKPVSPTDDMTDTQKFLAGTGKGFVDIGRGVGQMLGLKSQEEIDAARKMDAPLMDTGAGVAGNITGSIAAAVPAMMVPGANSIGGAAALGGVMNALQPTATGESRLKNTAVGAALGGAGQYGLGKLAGAMESRLANKTASEAARQSQNAPRDAALQAGREAGYVTPPSMAEGNLPGRILEGLSGKYKTNQLAGIRNQDVTDNLARKAVGLAPDQAITAEALKDIRNQAFQRGYEPVASVGRIETDPAYQSALDNIVSKYQGAAADFPGVASDSVTKLVNGAGETAGLRVKSFDAGNAVKMTQILRDEASDAFRSGDSALGKAKRDAAKAIEDQIERGIAASGQDGAELLKNFRDARTLMAKSHSVEQALMADGGKVNAKALGSALQRGKPLTGELKTIGAFANNFKDVAGVPKSGAANPFTIMDFGFGMGTGSPALPMARVAARYGLLSGPGQKAFATPQYGPGAMDRLSPEVLKKLEKMGVGGLLGYAAQ